MVAVLETATTDYARFAEQEAHAHVDHKSAWSTALLTAEGKSADERKAKADLATLDVYRAKMIAEARSTAAMERMRSARAQLSALQTLSRSVKDQT